jgi:hypothetical protein
MTKDLAVLFLAVGLGYGERARAQGSYRNLDAGLPLRIKDAAVAMDLAKMGGPAPIVR